MPVKIAIEGYRFVLPALGLAILGFLLGWIWIGTLGVVFGVFFLWFFRDPERHAPATTGSVVAPADGRVVGIVRIDDKVPASEEAKTRVSIFMSPFDVHINRMPVKGVIEEVRYTPGKFFAAYKDEAVEQNEQNAIVIGEPSGRKLEVVQVAGFLARRVVCKARKGDNMERGERFGLIMFGSRTDLYLPLDAEIVVKEGEKVKGGETVIGRFV